MSEFVKKFSTGALPSPKDSRDYPISRLIPESRALEANFCLKYGDIEDQGDVGACVGFSLAYTRAIKEWEQRGGEYRRMSPGFIYGNREPEDYQGEGMYPREALKNLQKYGCVLYNDFSVNEEYSQLKYIIDEHKKSLYEKAAPFKITAYAQIFFPQYARNYIKSAIKEIGPVTVQIPVYDSFYEVGSNGLVPMPDVDKEQINDYHQITYVGWREDNTFIGLNSWGKKWGANGTFNIPMSYPIYEAWSVTDEILPEPVKPQPVQYWRVQLGAFSVKANADKLAAELKAAGYQTYLPYDGKLFRVQVGAFSKEENAKRLEAELKVKGFSQTYVRMY